MRIELHTIESRHHLWGGEGAMIEDFASGIIAMGHKVLIVARVPKVLPTHSSDNRLVIPVKNIYDVPDVSQNLIVNRLILQKLTAYKTPDIVCFSGLGSFSAARLRAEKTKARLVYFANLPFALHRYITGEEELKQSWLWTSRIEDLVAYEKKIVHTVDLVVVAGESMQKFVAREYNLPQQRIFVAPHYVKFPTASYPPTTLVHHILQKRKGKARIILFVGRLVPQKGLHILFEAISLILKSYPAIQLVIAGTGERGETIPCFYQGIIKPECISFCGQVPRKDLPALYDVADIVVIPSIFEPFGIVCREAMARGKPIIASDVDGLSEGIENGLTGSLVTVEEVGHWRRYLCPTRLAKSIQYFIEFPNKAQIIGIAARQSFEKTWGSVSILIPLINALKAL